MRRDDRCRSIGSWPVRVPTALALLSLCLLNACATRTVAPPPAGAPAFPDFVRPAVPDALRPGPDAARLDAGWHALQAKDLAGAGRIFAEILQRRPAFYPAQTAAGYVAVAQGEPAQAVTAFDAALAVDPAYAPALAGRGEALLTLGREDEALDTFRAAHAADGALDLSARIDVLALRRVQRLITAARTAAERGGVSEARVAYTEAIAAAPEGAFLYRELGLLDVKAGDRTAALAHLRQAVALDGDDAVSWRQIGDLLAEGRDYDAARDAYLRAVDADPALDLADELTRIREAARLAAMPAEFRAIATAAQISRGDLAALVVDRLGGWLDRTTPRTAVATDVRGHWAAEAITRVIRAGVMDPLPNHTFQPRAAVRRAELASVASRLLALAAARDRALATRVAARPAIADVGRAHLDYPAVARAVAAGVMPLENGRFLPVRAVSGAEAQSVIDRLRQLSPELMASRP